MQNINGFMVYSFKTLHYHSWKDKLEMGTEVCKAQGKQRVRWGLSAGWFSIT